MSIDFDSSKFRILARRGLEKNVQTAGLVIGEIVYTPDTKKLWVGDGTGGAQCVAEIIVGPHDDKAYAKLEGRIKLIPLGIVGTNR